MIVDEPWLLDKVANEERLEMTFDQLLNHNINQTLPDYLKQIYRFFGLWVIIIGLFIKSLSRIKIINNKDIRLTLIFCTGTLCGGSMRLGDLCFYFHKIIMQSCHNHIWK